MHKVAAGRPDERRRESLVRKIAGNDAALLALTSGVLESNDLIKHADYLSNAHFRCSILRGLRRLTTWTILLSGIYRAAKPIDSVPGVIGRAVLGKANFSCR